jgi:hypothetical protein
MRSGMFALLLVVAALAAGCGSRGGDLVASGERSGSEQPSAQPQNPGPNQGSGAPPTAGPGDGVASVGHGHGHAESASPTGGVPGPQQPLPALGPVPSGTGVEARLVDVVCPPPGIYIACTMSIGQGTVRVVGIQSGQVVEGTADADGIVVARTGAAGRFRVSGTSALGACTPVVVDVRAGEMTRLDLMCAAPRTQG